MSSKHSKFNFTEAKVKTLTPAAGMTSSGKTKKRNYYYDEKSPGLEICVTAKGVKTFSSYRWFPPYNKALRVTIGRYPDISLANARKENSKNVLLMQKGVDPSKSKRDLREEATLGELYELLMVEYYQIERQDSVYDYKLLFKNHLKTWQNRKLSNISTQDVVKLRNRIHVNSGKFAANKVLRFLSSLFNKAKIYAAYEGENPTKGIPCFPTTSRKRKLERDEAARFFPAVCAEKNTIVRDAVLILIFTGARKSNVLSMRWEQINFDSETWYIPDTKNGEDQFVPLVPEVMSILEERRGNDSEWVFPSHKHDSKTGHVNTIQKGWQRIIKRAEIENFRIHDLRRSFGSWQLNEGASLSIIRKSLNHKSLQSTDVYAKMNIDPVRASMEKAAIALREAGGGLHRKAA